MSENKKHLFGVGPRCSFPKTTGLWLTTSAPRHTSPWTTSTPPRRAPRPSPALRLPAHTTVLIRSHSNLFGRSPSPQTARPPARPPAREPPRKVACALARARLLTAPRALVALTAQLYTEQLYALAPRFVTVCH